MRLCKAVMGPFLLSVFIAGALAQAQNKKTAQRTPPASSFNQVIQTNAQQMLQEGQKTFRYDTFGDETFWGDTLHLHQAIAGEKNGGVGPGVSPKTALSVGLKVDADAIPPALAAKIKAGQVNLDDPATTLALLKLNAVVGVTGFFDAQGKIGE